MMYRPGVGAMILNSKGKVFVAKRMDMSSGFQMPQGGSEKNESLEVTLFRELKEEMSTNNFKILHKLNYELYYDFPLELQSKIYRGEYLGQRITWFLLQFDGKDSEINLQTQHPEFAEWQWADVSSLVHNVIAFKKTMYCSVVSAFTPFFYLVS